MKFKGSKVERYEQKGRVYNEYKLLGSNNLILSSEMKLTAKPKAGRDCVSSAMKIWTSS